MDQANQGFAAELRRQRAIWLVALAAMLLVGAIQRNQRALLLTQAPRPSAFAAIVPPAASSLGTALASGGPLPDALSALRRSAGRPGGAQAFFSQPSGTGATGGGVAVPTSNLVAPAGVVAAGAGTPAASTGTANAGTGGQGAGGSGLTTGTGPLAAGPGAVGAVPEPATWMMMILGLAGIGWLARRRRGTTPA